MAYHRKNFPCIDKSHIWVKLFITNLNVSQTKHVLATLFDGIPYQQKPLALLSPDIMKWFIQTYDQIWEIYVWAWKSEAKLKREHTKWGCPRSKRTECAFWMNSHILYPGFIMNKKQLWSLLCFCSCFSDNFCVSLIWPKSYSEPKAILGGFPSITFCGWLGSLVKMPNFDRSVRRKLARFENSSRSTIFTSPDLPSQHKSEQNERKRKKLWLSIESWLFNRDLYNGLWNNPHITG